jgi:hypothetical protein
MPEPRIPWAAQMSETDSLMCNLGDSTSQRNPITATYLPLLRENQQERRPPSLPPGSVGAPQSQTSSSLVRLSVMGYQVCYFGFSTHSGFFCLFLLVSPEEFCDGILHVWDGPWRELSFEF